MNRKAVSFAGLAAVQIFCMLGGAFTGPLTPPFTGPVTSAFAQTVGVVKLNDIVKHDLFTWFHFTEAERETVSPTVTAVMYQTGVGGHSVQMIVSVSNTESTKDEVQEMTLFLPRAFISDTKFKMFARDVAKSFLNEAVPEPDQGATKSLANEIAFAGENWQQPVKANVTNESTGQTTKDVSLTKAGSEKLKAGDTAWMGQKPPTDLPSTASEGFLTFSGKKDEFTQKLSACSIRLKNLSMKGKDMFMMEVARTH